MRGEFCNVYAPNAEMKNEYRCDKNCEECSEYNKYIKRHNRKVLLWFIISLIILNGFAILFSKGTPSPNLVLWICGFSSGGFFSVYLLEKKSDS